MALYLLVLELALSLPTLERNLSLPVPEPALLPMMAKLALSRVMAESARREAGLVRACLSQDIPGNYMAVMRYTVAYCY